MRRSRFALLSVALFGVVALVTPSVAAADHHYQASHRHHPPRHNLGLTIAATPNPVLAGEGVLIYGKLEGSDVANQQIYLYHRIVPASHFTLISITRTNAYGFYEFTRAEGVVMSNRNWFVVGPAGTHSRTMHERVAAVVTLNTSTMTTDTGTPVQFTGTVTPNHPSQRVLLQEQNSTSGNGWSTIASAMTTGNSSFAFSRAFRTPGSYTLRAYFPNDPRNIAGASDPVTVTVQQQQVSSFTISGSEPVIQDGQSETISGTLYKTGSTTTPQSSVPVTLYGAHPADGGFKALATTTTDSSGHYSFTQTPPHNTIYLVRTQGTPSQRTADLFIGVQDVVTINAGALTTTVGASVTVTGTVTPDHTGHVVYLQRLDAAGDWDNVATSRIGPGSTYSFSYRFGQLGTAHLRAAVPGGPENLGGNSAAVTVVVAGLAPVTSLPPAS